MNENREREDCNRGVPAGSSSSFIWYTSDK